MNKFGRLDDQSHGVDKYDLQRRYLDLTRDQLPRLAESMRWCVRDDHCFMRIVLDHLFGGCWYDHLDRRLTAYKQLSPAQLAEAIGLCERMIEEGEPLVWRMQVQSLRWRGRVTTF